MVLWGESLYEKSLFLVKQKENHKLLFMTDISESNSMENLVKELNVLLKLLEHEHVSSATAEKMRVVKNLVGQIKPSEYVDTVNRSDFIYMNTSLYGNGTSFVESLFEEFDCHLKELRDSPVELNKHEEEETLKQSPRKSSLTDTPPPLPTTPPPEDYYEEAIPLDPDTTPQYITSNRNPSPVEDEDTYYEDADKNYPLTRINGPSYNDSDALSSSYESYDEEEDESKNRKRTRPACPVKDCHKFAFLLRKKRFGQWTKQLTVIRGNRLQCFKNPKDRTPHTDLPLNLCTVVYVCKDGKRKRHELKFAIPGGESLVLAVQSKEQAESWIKAIQKVNDEANGTTELENSAPPMIQHKTEPGKTMLTDKHTSDSDSATNGDCSRESGETGKGKKGSFSELTGSMGRAAGRKINRIISFSKKKPPLPDTNNMSHTDDSPRCGYLNVLVNQCWKERWCCVSRSTLFFYKDRADIRTHTKAVVLNGVEVLPGFGPQHPFAFRILRDGREVAVLEASCSEEMGRWLGVLLAEAGCAATPEALHYDYIDVDTISSIRSAARHSFLWATSSSSASTDSRTYDEVPYETMLLCQVSKATQPKSGTQVKRRNSFSSHDSVKNTSEITVKRHGSAVNQNGKYGKTRAEEDARRLLNEKDLLEKEKEEIRKKLVLLRKEKRDVKEQLKEVTDKQQKYLETCLAQLEESCRGKEAERVDLELRLTEVKENLKKAVASGELGEPAENKVANKVHVRKVETTYVETSVPVNCASELRKRPPSICAPTRGNVMQKAKEWESKKETQYSTVRGRERNY